MKLSSSDLQSRDDDSFRYQCQVYNALGAACYYLYFYSPKYTIPIIVCVDYYCVHLIRYQSEALPHLLMFFFINCRINKTNYQPNKFTVIESIIHKMNDKFQMIKFFYTEEKMKNR